jgi:hypothetical protein
MQTERQNLEINTRTYFLQQGQSIGKLYQILNSDILTSYLKRGISILLEILLLLVFIIMVVLIFLIPLDPIQYTYILSEDTYASVKIHNNNFTAIIIIIKALLFIVALMPLSLSFLLRRNRKKGMLLHKAFEEVSLMKEQFDVAVRDLYL